MLQLNLPEYSFRIKKQEDKLLIFDSQRKRYVSLTPEEWVRQHFIRFLIEEKGYPAAYLAIEKQLSMNGMKKRCDAILYNEHALPILIIELKAPNVAITQSTFDQVAVYNAKLKVDYFMISNGIEHYCCKVDSKNSKYEFFTELPEYSCLLNKY
ncbi:MAG: type I restriction enzyme HsdR N-terminal domain-containing protein [Bacteroidota bacterium]|nr:type I restriction enzyme HsdR N-terminal domain-containing protein [Bacteroidota bacterium]